MSGPIHIRPSRHCMILAAVLLAMWLAAINYDNSLAYVVLFLVSSLALVSAVHTYRNLEGIEIRPGRVWPAFAGSDLQLNVRVETTGVIPSFGIRLGMERNASSRAFVEVGRIAPGENVLVDIFHPVARRGRGRIEKLVLSTRYPMGLLEAFREISLGMEYIVYPRPIGERDWPEAIMDLATQDDGRISGGEDYYGSRAYQPGESPRRIDWKAVARGRPLMVKEFAGGGTGRIWFEWDNLAGMGDEARLSQLTRWVVEADDLGCSYGLRLPQRTFEPASGPSHYEACLTALAVFKR